MPYISKESRAVLEADLASLNKTLVALVAEKPEALAGLLNYSISVILSRVIQDTGGWRYHKIAVVTGVLKNASDEFYRRVVSLYEDDQIDKNGDIDEYACGPY